MDRVLITGGMGFLGSHLTQRFLDRGCEVWALDLFEAPCAEVFKQYDKYHLIIDTIKNLDTLRKLVDRCDLVCHLAAVACPDQYISKTRKVMDITLRSGLDVVELIRLTGKFLFFTSTSEVYGRNPKVPWKEDDDRVLGSTDIDRWCYSSAKATLEHYIRACHLDEQLNYLNIRVFNCYGPRLRDRVVDRFVDAAIGQEPLHIHGDGSHTRCFTYVDDLIDGTLQLLDTPSAHNRVYNIGNTLETSVLELAQTVNRIAGPTGRPIALYTSLGGHGQTVRRHSTPNPRLQPHPIRCGLESHHFLERWSATDDAISAC